MWSRGLVRGSSWVIPNCRLSVSAQQEAPGIDDFLHSISSAPTVSPSKNQTVLETSAEFCKWLDKKKIKSVDQFITAAQMAINVRSAEQKEAFSKIDNLAKQVLPGLYPTFEPKTTVETLRYALQFDPENEISKDIQNLFIEKDVTLADLESVSFATLVMIIRYADSSVDKSIMDKVVKAINIRIDRELCPANLFALLAGTGYDNAEWFHNKKFIEKAEQLVTVMNMSEKCALLNHMSANRQRNVQLIGAIVNSICYSNQHLTVSQIVSVTASCSNLTYYPPKMAKKISEDLAKNANVIKKWSDVIGISSCFVRMRLGNEKSWDLLIRWAIENEKQANVKELSRFVSGLARIGVPSGKPLAKALKAHLAPRKAATPTSWLNSVYSLAYFQELDEIHVDSVLNKSFVDQIMNSTMENHDRLRKAMTLLMISAAAKIDLPEYKGPTVDKQTFAQYGIKFDAKTLIQARQLKYSSNQSECDEWFLKYLFKLAPRDTHCKLPNIEECGAFVDTYVMPDKKSGLLVSSSQWGCTKPRPLFFYGWMQSKQNMESVESESKILGPEQLALRLIRAEGFDPVVIFKSELEYCSSDIDKVNLLRDKIHKKN
uniref:Uncharacterized protein n=1 Tax=Caenorhabditis japonica TaxID=281687 RepID=A0A8R1I5M3_CAEJA